MAPERFNVLNSLRFVIKRFNECVTFEIKSALRRFKCWGSLNSVGNVGKRLEPLANLRETLWLLARALRLRTSDWGIFLPEGDNTHTDTQFFYHLQSATRGAQRRGWTVFGVSCWLT